jgi:hypothetical protein
MELKLWLRRGIVLIPGLIRESGIEFQARSVFLAG